MSDVTFPVGIEVDEQFFNAKQQRHAAQLGMWIWLMTELLLFAGLFLVAVVLHVMHPASVRAAVLHQKFWIGATNSIVLICSSFTMSGAIMLSRMGWQRWMVRCMLVTAALGSLFLLLKGYEYYSDYAEHMTPLLDRPYVLDGDPASRLFTNLYFITTALHGVHLTTGVGVMLWMAWQARVMPSRIASFIEVGLAVCMILTVLLFSMGVRLEAPLMRFFFLLGFAWVCILFGMVLLDYLSR